MGKADIKIIHGIFTLQWAYCRKANKNTGVKTRIKLPEKLYNLMCGVALRNCRTRIEFTWAIDKTTQISSIAIVHEMDSFNRKFGYKAAYGRLKRALGTVIPFAKWKYKKIPEYINFN